MTDIPGTAVSAERASHTKDTYLAARFRRLAARKGKKRAIVAVAHTILVSMYQQSVKLRSIV